MESNGLGKSIRRIRNVGRGPSTGDTGSPQKRSRRWSRILAVAVIACIVFVGIAGAARGLMVNRMASSVTALTEKDMYFEPVAQPTTAAASMEGTGADGASSMRDAPNTGGGQPGAQAQPWDRMIIRTGTLQLKVKDVSNALNEVRSLAGGHGGYISQSDSRQEGDYTVATITLQVPAREFDNVISKLRQVGVKTISENIASSDVTEEYTDLQSQLRNLQATETRMLALQAKAVELEDILTLDRELRQIQGEIERIQGRVIFLSKRSEMSTLTVSFYPEIAPVEPMTVTEEGWDPARAAAEAWNASLDMLSDVANVLIRVAVFMWWAVPLLLLATWLALRPRKRQATPSAPAGEAS
ncbi:MAG TPA: DUF4349 domain-containing protein [Chloroflexia bacterium]|nr:DUF4349 domain-containing protein [Chloroflexia bacterium]